MTKKIILFGSIANITFLYNDELWKNVIFIADNNNSLHGKRVNGVLIIDPDSIPTIEYDEILVLTWAFNQIKNQLVAIGIPEVKISSVNKRLVSLSVFESEDVRKSALECVSDLCIFSQSLGLNIYVEAGTLLGIVRDKDLLSWDSDIDFSVGDENFLNAYDLLVEFSRKESSVYNLEINNICGVSRQITGRIIIEDQIIPFDVFTRTIENQLSWSMSGDFFACDAIHFEDIEVITFEDYFFTVPVDFKKYLSSIYGPDWRIPKYNFSYADFNYCI